MIREFVVQQKKKDFNFSQFSNLEMGRSDTFSLSRLWCFNLGSILCSFGPAGNASQVSCTSRRFRAEKKCQTHKETNIVRPLFERRQNVPELKLWNAFKCRLFTKTWRHSLALLSSGKKTQTNGITNIKLFTEQWNELNENRINFKATCAPPSKGFHFSKAGRVLLSRRLNKRASWRETCILSSSSRPYILETFRGLKSSQAPETSSLSRGGNLINSPKPETYFRINPNLLFDWSYQMVNVWERNVFKMHRKWVSNYSWRVENLLLSNEFKWKTFAWEDISGYLWRFSSIQIFKNSLCEYLAHPCFLSKSLKLIIFQFLHENIDGTFKFSLIASRRQNLYLWHRLISSSHASL